MVQRNRTYRVVGKRDGLVKFECISNPAAMPILEGTDYLKDLGFCLSELKKGTCVNFSRRTGRDYTFWKPTAIVR